MDGRDGMKLSADAGTPWVDFTEQHARVRERACAVAAGAGADHTAAIVGVYGAGKSTLLLHVLREARSLGIVAAWDEAGPFLERLVPAGSRVRAHEFVRRVHAWALGLRGEVGLAAHAGQLADRGRRDVAEATRAQAPAAGRRVVLLLDEMEQAHALFAERVQTDDGNPLRSLADACGAELGLLIGYAPESFQALGAADRGRHRVLRIPALRASTIARHFGLPRGPANFAWWASRGRARGVLQAIDAVVRPLLAGEFAGDAAAIADAIDLLPPVFGVPAIVRDRVPATRLPELVRLAPAALAGPGVPGVRFDLRGEERVLAELEAALMAHLPPDARAAVQIVARELVVILDACADEEGQAAVPQDQIDALWRLAVARAQESGRAAEVGEDWRNSAIFALLARGVETIHRALPVPLARLVDELFPSPFGDPLLPIAGRHPTRLEVEREFLALAGGDPEPLAWAARGVVFVRDEAALEGWLSAGGAGEGTWVVALLQAGERPRGPRTLLLVEAGRLSVVRLPAFSADFIKSALVSASFASLRGDLAALTEGLATTKDLRRKVRWHLDRLEVLFREAHPHPAPTFEAAAAELREHLLPFLRQRRLMAESPALLALVPVAHAVAPETRARLAELGDLLKEGRLLRALARGARLHGAGVVVDELLPAGPGRWVWDGSTPHLQALLGRHALVEARRELARLLAPEHAASLAIVLTAEVEEAAAEERDGGAAALRRLTRALEGAREIHEGIAALIGEPVERIPREVSLGAALDALVEARPELTRVQALVAEVDATSEPWARALVRWVAARFAEAVHHNLAGEEPALREWELRAAEGKALGAEIEALLVRLRGLELVGLAASLGRGRARVRGHLGGAEALRHELARLRERIAEHRRIAEVLEELAVEAGRRGVACQELLRRYEPTEAEVREDPGLLRGALELLRRAEERPPAPAGVGLRAWARRVVEFLAKGRLDRLRARVDAALSAGGALDGLDPVHEEDVAAIEAAWPRLAPEFQAALTEELAGSPVAGSPELCRRIVEALEKQELARAVEPAGWAEALDRALVRLAASPRRSPAWVRGQIEARRALGESLANHAGRSAPRGALEAVLQGSEDYDEAQRSLEGFLERAERCLSRLRELEVEAPALAEAGPEAVLEALEAALRAGEREFQRQLQRLEAVAGLQRRLELRAVAAGWTRSSRVLAWRIAEAEAQVHAALDRRAAEVRARAERLGVAEAAIELQDPERRLEAIAGWAEAVGKVEALQAEVTARGGPRRQGQARPAREVLAALQAELRELAEAHARLSAALERQAARARALGVEAPAPASGRVQDLEAAFERGRQALREALHARVRGLGPDALATWSRLQKGQWPRGLRELLEAGLIAVVDEEG